MMVQYGAMIWSTVSFILFILTVITLHKAITGHLEHITTEEEPKNTMASVNRNYTKAGILFFILIMISFNSPVKHGVDKQAINGFNAVPSNEEVKGVVHKPKYQARDNKEEIERILSN